MTAASFNRLKTETSPYLRQHQDNPVHWWPWGDAAFAAAAAADKPVLLSIGYAACHWCHVMAHESFENEAIAEQMNRLFICIKVDREERPDVDAIYMKALHLVGQQGGWPLTMFLTPSRQPIWGGTYFPPTPRYGRPGFGAWRVAMSSPKAVNSPPPSSPSRTSGCATASASTCWRMHVRGSSSTSIR